MYATNIVPSALAFSCIMLKKHDTTECYSSHLNPIINGIIFHITVTLQAQTGQYWQQEGGLDDMVHINL